MTTKLSDALLQKLAVRGSVLPVGKRFIGQKTKVIKGGLVSDRSTDEYSDGTYRTPVPMNRVTSFGSRFISPAHQKSLKNSVDFYVPVGVRITSPADGTISNVIENSNVHGISIDYWLKGNGIGITCPNGERIWLEHLRHGFATKLGIRTGQKVKAGDVIGISGNTGFSENPHVHMELNKFVGDCQSKDSPYNYMDYVTEKIRFSADDIPFDLYKKEVRRRHTR
jgi:murein DD-endopeptidase MepM/ murein hydrolase activator NlpD